MRTLEEMRASDGILSPASIEEAMFCFSEGETSFRLMGSVFQELIERVVRLEAAVV